MSNQATQLDSINDLIQQAYQLYEAQQYGPAASLCDQLLAVAAAAEIYHLRALITQAAGRPRKSLHFYEQAVKLQPTSAVIRNNFASALEQIGECAAAVAQLKLVAKAEPPFVGGWLNLARLLHEQKRFVEAEKQLLEFVRKVPEAGQLWHWLGLTYERLRMPEHAEKCFLQAIEKKPNESGFYNDLGSNYQRSRRFRKALASFARAVELKPEYAAAWSNLGTVQEEMGDSAGAENSFRIALQLRPRFAIANYNLANLLKEQNRTEEAVEYYRRALERRPENVDFMMNLAVALNTLGKFSESIALCRRAIKIDPECTKAYYSLFTFAHDQVTAAEVQALQSLLKKPTLSDEQKSGAYFSLARRAERLKSYDAAFAYYRLANDHVERGREFNYGQLQQMVNEMIDVYDDQFFERVSHRGSDSSQPLFILGMPRSGSTLVDQILTAHSQVNGVGEFEGIRLLINQFLLEPNRESKQEKVGRAYPRSVASQSPGQITAMSEFYLKKMHQKVTAETRYISDKMPNNAFHIGLLHLLFPHAKIIYTRRNPIDICLSCYFQNFTTAHNFSFNLRNTGLFYKEHERLMQHWLRVLPGRIHFVDYEKLVADPESETRYLIETVCQLPWEAVCLQHENNQRPVTTASLWQVRQPIYHNSVEKWRRYEKHLGPLLEVLGLPES